MIYRWVYWLRHPFMTNWFLTSFNCVFPSCLITVACDSSLCWAVWVKMACFFKRSPIIYSGIYPWNSVCELSEQSISFFFFMMCVQHEQEKFCPFRSHPTHLILHVCGLFVDVVAQSGTKSRYRHIWRTLSAPFSRLLSKPATASVQNSDRSF